MRVQDEYPWKSYHATNASASGNASFTFSWWGSGAYLQLLSILHPLTDLQGSGTLATLHLLSRDCTLTGRGRIHGGYRKWSSGYQVILDDQPPQLYEGYGSGDEIFDQVLYQATDLVVGPHHIRITNAGHDVEHPILDFEYVSVLSSVKQLLREWGITRVGHG